MSDNFIIYVDREGKMPVLRRRATVIASHPHFVRYVNNVPMEVKPYPGQDQVWDYATSSYESLCIVKLEDADDSQPAYVGTYAMCSAFLRRAKRYSDISEYCIKNLYTGRLMSFVV